MAKLTKRSKSMLAASSEGELKKKLLAILLAVLLYRLGSYIPLPGVNPAALSDVVKTQSAGVLGMLNMFTGGALGRMSIFALNIMPYITASIIMQLMTVISPTIGTMKKEGETGRNKIAQYSKYLTIALSIFQGYGIIAGVEAMNQSSNNAILLVSGWHFKIIAILSLVGGTMFVVWLGEQITAHGLGNGSSLIIFTGIVSGLPSAIVSLFEMGRTGVVSTTLILAIIFLGITLVAFIVFMEKAQRRITVQYPKRQIGNKIYGADATHLPLKLNTSGVIPPIFASSILLFPVTIVNFSFEEGAISTFILLYLSHGKPLYILLYIALICFFSFFYTSVVFNPDETADMLRKNGAVVLGRRPGAHTAQYLDYVITRITVIGILYMSFVCIIPEILIAEYGVPFYLGGTSLLIVVNVVMDVFTNIQTYLLNEQYSHLIKKNKIIRSY